MNNDGVKPDTKILLTYNSETEWLATLLLIMSPHNTKMVVVEGLPVWLPVLDVLGFTVNTVYYGGKIL